MVYIYHNLANISTEKKENSGKSSVKVNKCLLKKKLDGRSELHVHNEKTWVHFTHENVLCMHKNCDLLWSKQCTVLFHSRRTVRVYIYLLKKCSHAQKLKHHAIYIYIEIFGPLYSFIFNNIVKDRYIKKKLQKKSVPTLVQREKLKHQNRVQ